MDTDAGFSKKRLPHLERMSAEQHALITLINAACYVIDEQPKQVLFAKLCEHIGIKLTS